METALKQSDEKKRETGERSVTVISRNLSTAYQRSTLALKLWLSISLLFPGDWRLAMASNVPSDHETTATKSENDEQSGKSAQPHILIMHTVNSGPFLRGPSGLLRFIFSF